MADPQPLEPLVQIDIIKVTADGAHPQMDVVATEVPMTIMAGTQEVATLMCTPEHLADLARGFLLTSGLVRQAGDVRACIADPARWVVEVELTQSIDPELLVRRTFTSGCGKGVVLSSSLEMDERVVPDGFRVPAARVQSLANWFRRYSDLHHATGGVHTVALSRAGAEPALVRDDVGRHNALDKVIGRAVAEGMDVRECMVVTSGRVSSEIVHKAARAGIPVVISLGAPTHQGVLVARHVGLTVVGFARQARFSIFSAAQRIVLPE